MDEEQFLVALSAFLPLGPDRLNLLVSYFGSYEGVWGASKKTLLELGINEKIADGFLQFRKSFSSKYFLLLKKLGIGYVTYLGKNYPRNLNGIKDFPATLYIKGEIDPEDELSIAVVGSRRMSKYGEKVCITITRDLVKAGVCIVSGLARGIDTVAHWQAIKEGGRTIAVMGGGLDRIYPPENKILAHKIINGHGALVSEFPLNYPPLPENFLQRNRIVSGLSRGVLVIEGAERSGTLSTASHAAEQGKDVFAVPGEITSPLSAAPHFLIKNGAKLTTSVEDILEEINIPYSLLPKK